MSIFITLLWTSVLGGAYKLLNSDFLLYKYAQAEALLTTYLDDPS